MNTQKVGHAVALVAIQAPSSENVSQLAAEASEAVSKVRKDSPIFSAVYQEVSSLFLDYSNYPDAVKFVSLVVKSDAEDKTPAWDNNGLLVEYFAPNEEAGMLRENGEIPVQNDKIRTSGEWNNKNDWARKKYGFLFEIGTDSELPEGISP